ncbi:hypothetical protein DFZ98_16465 [Escherichia coli]|nr:hypothetical protein [Escherichia coli]EFD0701871.1 hypothetical protein [Escherichia coli]EFD0749944.1 hypothetical protein [Escherichia coli]TYT64044.1 hypothetical protein FY450_23560 [Escherichia coli]TYT68184.1 hypothetical protein FY450_01310 [Escherichia coli]
MRVSSAANFVCRTTVEISIDILFQEISLGHLVPTQQPFTHAYDCSASVLSDDFLFLRLKNPAINI